MEALARNVSAGERRFVDAASYLSVSILPSFSQEKAKIGGKRERAELRTFQCKSISPRASWLLIFLLLSNLLH